MKSIEVWSFSSDISFPPNLLFQNYIETFYATDFFLFVFSEIMIEHVLITKKSHYDFVYIQFQNESCQSNLTWSSPRRSERIQNFRVSSYTLSEKTKCTEWYRVEISSYLKRIAERIDNTKFNFVNTFCIKDAFRFLKLSVSKQKRKKGMIQ